MKAVYRIQYASNLFVHQNQSIEQAKKLLTLQQANSLALLGNIGFPANSKTQDFLHWCCSNWHSVFWVPGPTELAKDHQVNSFQNDYEHYKNLHILDHKQHTLSYAPIAIVGVPLWVPSRGKWNLQLNETERYFLTNKSMEIVGNWHKEDVEFIQEKVKSYHQDIYQTKIILLTHHLPSSHLLPPNANTTDHLLFAGNGEILRMPNLLGCLSGAGGTTKNGNFGPKNLFCGVNAAFTGPDMVPNSLYKPDLVAEFPLDFSSPKPQGYGVAFQRFSFTFSPVPSVAVQLQ